VRVTFCGVRGSTPAPGADYVRYGGCTSCVALAHDGQPPSLVLDAGTGLRTLDAVLDGAAYRGTILLGHLHWDHTHGLPFFRSGAREGARVDVRLPEQDGDAEETLARAFSPPHFPVTPAQLGPGYSYRALPEGEHDLDGFVVTAVEIPHKGGRTLGFRVSSGDATVAYLSDHSPVAYGEGDAGLGALHPAALRLAEGVDLLIHDAQHTAAEFAAVAYLGHSAVEYAVALKDAAGARTLALFHHAPDRSDEEIDAIVAGLGRADVFAAAEGVVVDL
jgi:phosphoribosyl 1,2-cyclic phosphodiesterase